MSSIMSGDKMPLNIEHEGKSLTVYTESELQEAIDKEVKGLKITNENLKAEKTEAIEKAREAKELALAAEEAKAKAEGDTESLKRIHEEREQEAKAKLNEFKNTIKAEKVTNMLNQVIDEVGASGQLKEDLRDLIKARVQFDYDMDTHSATVRAEGISNVEELVKHIKESGRYDAYLPGDGSLGGGSPGNSGAGASTRKFEDYTTAELTALHKADPAAYERLRSTASHLKN